MFHGGVESATSGLVTALRNHGHDVHLLSFRGQRAVPGVTIHQIRQVPLPAVGRLLVMAAGAAIVSGRGAWDVVQSHERTLRQDVYRAGEGCHVAYLATRRRPGRGLYHRVVLALERRVFTTTPHVVAISRAGADEIARLYPVGPDRLSTIYNGVDLDRFHPDNRGRHRRGARSEAGVPEDAWLLLFVGSGFARKGLDTAIAALAGMSDRASRLLVTGKGDTGPYADQARQLGVAGRVGWLGPRQDIERWYAAADVVVLPTRYEPFGNVHLEALASGVPVVTSTRAGGAELIAAARNGGVADPEDPASFSRALDRVRAGAGESQREAARRSAEPFTYARQVGEFEALWRRLGKA